MKHSVIALLIILSPNLFAQNKNTTFYDSLGRVTTWEGHWAQVIAGYKTVYTKKENKRTLIRMTPEEFKKELHETERKITKKEKLGTDFPDFEVIDINGNRLSKAELKGKVLVLNFWFVGCSPCEMERPTLNNLTKLYAANTDVVFISFARNEKEQVAEFLNNHTFLYHVVPAGKNFIETTLGSNAYPANIIIDRKGKYYFNSTAAGIGMLTILQKQIDNALVE